MKKEKKTPGKPGLAGKRKGSQLNKLCAGVAATGLACSGASPQVRPEPPGEECPAGSIELMKERFDLYETDESPGGTILPEHRWGSKTSPVREGPVVVDSGALWRKLPAHSMVHGRYVIGKERVYGRLTHVVLPGGEMFPVCIAIVEQRFDGKQGLVIKGFDESGAPKVRGLVDLRVVERFE